MEVTKDTPKQLSVGCLSQSWSSSKETTLLLGNINRQDCDYSRDSCTHSSPILPFRHSTTAWGMAEWDWNGCKSQDAHIMNLEKIRALANVPLLQRFPRVPMHTKITKAELLIKNYAREQGKHDDLVSSRLTLKLTVQCAECCSPPGCYMPGRQVRTS